MRVKIEIEFEIETDVDDDELTEDVAKTAAELAAFDYLAFVKISGQSTDSERVEVHVDGFGECFVRLVEP